MNAYCGGRSSCPARLFSLGLLDGPQVRLRHPHLREATAGVGLSRLATAFMTNPGSVIKNGSAGTGMVPLIGTAITEEEAWFVINYERSFEGK
jgi:hypothetical protein